MAYETYLQGEEAEIFKKEMWKKERSVVNCAANELDAATRKRWTTYIYSIYAVYIFLFGLKLKSTSLNQIPHGPLQTYNLFMSKQWMKILNIGKHTSIATESSRVVTPI